MSLLTRTSGAWFFPEVAVPAPELAAAWWPSELKAEIRLLVVIVKGFCSIAFDFVASFLWSRPDGVVPE